MIVLALETVHTQTSCSQNRN